MDIGTSSEHTNVDEYTKENYTAQHLTSASNSNSMLAPQHHPQHQPPAMLLKKEHEPWRGPSSFGLANILNQSIRSSSSSSNNNNNNSNASVPSLPKFSLPSLHSFGNPLLSKPEISIGAQHQQHQHSLLNPQQRSPAKAAASHSDSVELHDSSARSVPIHTSEPSGDRKPPGVTKETTPRKNHNSNSNVATSRRIAPAPADDDEGDQDDDLSGSIRGGRWTADEHERFLAGFRIHGHKWKRVQQVVRTRSVTQVRTHAQKYLLKVAKLKAEKKQGKAVDVSSLNDRYLSGRGGDSSSDVEPSNTAPNSPDRTGSGGNTRYYDDGFDAGEPSPKRATPRKKTRHSEPHVDILDQEYIAAAATTLCFLMSQKIDSLFDNRSDMDKDLEPYDCYSEQSPAGNASDDARFADKSRKRTYMHFLTDSPVQYQADGGHFAYEDSQRTETPSYAIEGKKLYS